MSVGLKYHNHNENHYSKDTQHSIKKEIITTGRCLKHPDIQIYMLGGLIPKECKRCAKEYKLNIEIEQIKNKIQICEKLTELDDKYQTIETQSCSEVFKVDMGTQTEVFTAEIEIQTETQSQVVKVDVVTQTEVFTTEIEIQTDEIKATKEPQIYDKPKPIIQKTVMKKCPIVKREKIKYPIKYPLIEKTISEAVIDGIIYTLCEVKLPQYDWQPYTNIITQKWFKIKQNDFTTSAPTGMSRTKFCEIIKNRDETEYLIGDIMAIRKNINLSYTYFNGAKILTQYPPLMYPQYKMVDGEWVKNHVINKSFTTREWCDFGYCNAEKILSHFKH